MTTFAALPAELRILIWQYSLPGPRNMVLSWNDNSFTSNLPPPNVAHVCHQSREEALKHYALIFAKADRPSNILFDNSMDTLFVTNEALQQLSAWDLLKIDRLRYFTFTGDMAQRCTS